jgi:polysaccharide biosynthesis/export protein
VSTQDFVKLCCLVAAVLVCGLPIGCATQPSQEVSVVSADADGVVDGGTIGETVVIPTEELMGDAGPSPEAAEPEATAPEAPDSPIPEVDMTYRIGHGDVLNFRSFDDPELSTQVVVRYDGCISLEVIPDLKVEGLTREEAEALLREEYSEFYMEPQLTLSIVQASSKTYTVLGEVSRPSEYPYTRPISLINAITSAGGMRVNQQGGDSYLGAQGQLVKALIIRHTGGDRQVMEFDLRGYRDPGQHQSDTPVLPGDVVLVPESANLIYLLGEVRSPRVYAISDGFTLIRLLSQAGGFNESTARLRHVVVTREVSDTETKLMTFDVRENMKAGTDMLLEPGDIIYVPRKKLVNLNEFIQRVTAPASSVMSFSQQVMGLYNQAYNTYYTKERFDLLYNNDNNTASPAAILQESLTGVSSALSGLQQLVPNTSLLGTP